MAHPSARADPACHLRRRTCAGEGRPIREIKAGDTVWIPPDEIHWHGAAPNTGMVHIAMQEALDGKHVTWMEYVTDEEYGQPVG